MLCCSILLARKIIFFNEFLASRSLLGGFYCVFDRQYLVTPGISDPYYVYVPVGVCAEPRPRGARQVRGAPTAVRMALLTSDFNGEVAQDGKTQLYANYLQTEALAPEKNSCAGRLT